MGRTSRVKNYYQGRRDTNRRCALLSPGHADGDRGGVIEQPTLAETIRGCFATFGGVDLELPPPRVVDEPSSFDP
jgi:hypothetical protein